MEIKLKPYGEEKKEKVLTESEIKHSINSSESLDELIEILTNWLEKK